MANTVIAYPYSGDYRVDVLLAQSEYTGQLLRWGLGAPFGTAATVSYSFMTAVPTYGGTDNGFATGFSAFTAAQRDAVRTIFGKLQQTVGLTFVEVADGATAYGDIRFGNNNQSGSSGYSWMPYSTFDDRGGDVWLDSRTSGLQNPTSGTKAWSILVHEIGHAIGLKHPGDYNAGTSGASQPGNYLGTSEDNANHTIMSYTEASGRQPRDWYGIYDLLALKTLYGSREQVNAGNTTHAYNDAAGLVLSIIDDASGVDTLDLSALTLGATVDLRAGAFSSVGRNGFAGAAINNLSIDLRTVVENFVGSGHNDTVVGNDVANRFFLGGGINTANGGAGIDTAVYSSVRGAHSVTRNGEKLQVNGPNMNDSLTSVERLEFANGKLGFDAAPLQTVKIIGALFGAPTIDARPDWVAIGVPLFDAGWSYTQVMQHAIEARFGGLPDAGALVDVLYTHVVGTPAPPQELAAYRSWIDSGSYTHAGLAVFAADTSFNLARIDYTGLAANGVAFA